MQGKAGEICQCQIRNEKWGKRKIGHKWHKAPTFRKHCRPSIHEIQITVRRASFTLECQVDREITFQSDYLLFWNFSHVIAFITRNLPSQIEQYVNILRKNEQISMQTLGKHHPLPFRIRMLSKMTKKSPFHWNLILNCLWLNVLDKHHHTHTF